jgi:hypothetical protein
VFAQTPQNDSPKDKTTIERLAEQVEALQAQLKHVQEQLAQMSGETAPAASPAVASGQDAVKPVEPVTDAQIMGADDETHKLGPFQMRGFGDIGFGRPVFENLPNAILKGSTYSFSLGDLDLFTTARISDRLSFLAELLITSDFTNSFGAEIDRMMLNYKVSDYFKIGVGKYNTAIGYYSNAFHRARYFQTATGRPLMFADEDAGGILPVHSVGVTTSGKLPSGPLGLHWVAEVANGRASTSLTDPSGSVVDVQNFVDENNTKAVNFALMAAPPAWRGFQVGASFYRDRLRPEPLPDMSQHIMSAHLVFVRTNFEILNEAAIVRHAYVGSGHVWKSLTSYTQLSRKFGSYRPYFRYDYQNTPKTEPLFGRFGQMGRSDGPSVGVRYDLADYAGLKLQYGRLSQRDLGWTNDFQIQVAFAF